MPRVPIVAFPPPVLTITAATPRKGVPGPDARAESVDSALAAVTAAASAALAAAGSPPKKPGAAGPGAEKPESAPVAAVAGGAGGLALADDGLDALDLGVELDPGPVAEIATPVVPRRDEKVEAVGGAEGEVLDLGGLDSLEGMDGGEVGVLLEDDELDQLSAPVDAAPLPSSRALLVYTALGAFFAVIGRGVSLRVAEGQLVDVLGPLLLAGVIGAFTALGIGVVDHTRVRLGWRKALYTALSGAVLGTLGSFCLVVPMFHVRSTFLRLLCFSAAIAVVDHRSQRGAAGAAPAALAGLVAGWLSSHASWIDPYSPAPWAMAATFGLMGLSVGMARRLVAARA